MSTWQDDIESALTAFLTVADLARDPIARSDIRVEFLPAPHRPPSRLPAGTMAVYGFWGDGCWLKIGKAGPKSNARYVSQHYEVGRAPYTLARSLACDPCMLFVTGFDLRSPGDWIMAETHRVNILAPSTRSTALLSLLETFLHVRLKPRYEGPRSQLLSRRANAISAVSSPSAP